MSDISYRTVPASSATAIATVEPLGSYIASTGSHGPSGREKVAGCIDVPVMRLCLHGVSPLRYWYSRLMFFNLGLVESTLYLKMTHSPGTANWVVKQYLMQSPPEWGQCSSLTTED